MAKKFTSSKTNLKDVWTNLPEEENNCHFKVWMDQYRYSHLTLMIQILVNLGFEDVVKQLESCFNDEAWAKLKVQVYRNTSSDEIKSLGMKIQYNPENKETIDEQFSCTISRQSLNALDTTPQEQSLIPFIEGIEKLVNFLAVYLIDRHKFTKILNFTIKLSRFEGNNLIFVKSSLKTSTCRFLLNLNIYTFHLQPHRTIAFCLFCSPFSTQLSRMKEKVDLIPGIRSYLLPPDFYSVKLISYWPFVQEITKPKHSTEKLVHWKDWPFDIAVARKDNLTISNENYPEERDKVTKYIQKKQTNEIILNIVHVRILLYRAIFWFLDDLDPSLKLPNNHVVNLSFDMGKFWLCLNK